MKCNRIFTIFIRCYWSGIITESNILKQFQQAEMLFNLSIQCYGNQLGKRWFAENANLLGGKL